MLLVLGLPYSKYFDVGIKSLMTSILLSLACLGVRTLFVFPAIFASHMFSNPFVCRAKGCLLHWFYTFLIDDWLCEPAHGSGCC